MNLIVAMPNVKVTLRKNGEILQLFCMVFIWNFGLFLYFCLIGLNVFDNLMEQTILVLFRLVVPLQTPIFIKPSIGDGSYLVYSNQPKLKSSIQSNICCSQKG